MKVESVFLEKSYFIIVKFSDKFNTTMNMIGIIDYGPSNDPSTSLYSIIAPRGENSFCEVGSVSGVLVPPSKYNGENMDDFNYKAVLIKGQGIEASVRLSDLLPQTWFGRNLFTYYSTYCSLIDNINKYNQDYETKVLLKAEKDVKVHSEKDLNSETAMIKAGQKVYLIATDNKQWIAVATEEGIEGWVNVKDISPSHFSGYPVFD